MSNIRTYSDLLEEKRRLEATLVIQKEAIRNDLIELREKLRPAVELLAVVGKITDRSKSHPLIAMALNLAGGVFLGNMAVSRTSKIAGLIVPFVAEKVSAFFHSNKGANIFQKLAGRWKKNKLIAHTVE